MRWLVKRWWLWAGVLFMLAVIAAGYVLIPFHEGISQANCDKIQVGWTREQVEELLGHETGIVMGGARRDGDVDFLFMPNGEIVSTVIGWFDEDGNHICVYFNSTGSVCWKGFIPTHASLLERIKTRIEKRLHIRLP